jgi:hypothetical protein
MPGIVDIISEKMLDLDKLIPMQMMRDHTKTNDIVQVTDTQLLFYREVAMEQAELYTGRFVHRLVSIAETVETDTGRMGFRESYQVKLSYTPLGGLVSIGTQGGTRHRTKVKKDDRVVKVPMFTGEITWNDCCRPCGGPMGNRGYQAFYDSGYRTEDDVPSTILYGCLKFITWAMANPGDELLTVRNRLGTTETGLIGTNNGAWASGAIEHWQGYRVRR